MIEHRYVLGRCAYLSEQKNCEAAITWSLADGKFSMSAEIWNPRKIKCLACGQCVDTVASLFPDNLKAQRMAAIWRRWHLNNMNAGSPAQMQWLRDNPIDRKEYQKQHSSHYEVACDKLADAGLNPDATFMRDGKPYKYGSNWIAEELPADIIAEIESWG